MLLLSILFAVGQSLPMPSAPPAASDVLARVKACGFPSARATFDPTLQEDRVAVEGATDATDDQLKCVAKSAIATGHYVTFPAPIDDRYQPLYWEIIREHGRLAARAWLEERGLLSQLPVYDAKNPDETSFVRKLESLCGAKATGVLKPLDGMAMIKPEALTGSPADDEMMWCLMNVASASGYGLGFVGNEAYGPGQ